MCRPVCMHIHTVVVHDGANAPKLQQAVPVGCNCGHHRNSDSKLHGYSRLGERGQVQAMHPAGVPAAPPPQAAGCAGCVCAGRQVCVFEGEQDRPVETACLETACFKERNEAQMIQLDQVFGKRGLEARRQAHSGFQGFSSEKIRVVVMRRTAEEGFGDRSGP